MYDEAEEELDELDVLPTYDEVCVECGRIVTVLKPKYEKDELFLCNECKSEW